MNQLRKVVIAGIVAAGGCLALAQALPTNCPTPPAGEAKPWLNAKYTPQCRAKFVLDTLKTVDEKFAFLTSGGGGGGRAAAGPNPMADLGLVRGGGSDGPAGVARGTGVTAFPTPLSVAASFDPATATRFGDLMGQDFFDAGLNGVTGPAMDMTRTWHFGRSTESFGEDPFLAASIVAPEITAIQAHHVLTTMKHFAAYTQEQNRTGDQPTGSKPANDEAVSERALREIYLPDFQAAVMKGGGGNVMCSFPRINGIYACANPLTLGILKKEWGFDGSVGPDFPDAQRDVIPSFLAGLDSGQYGPRPAGGRATDAASFANEKSLRQGVDDGTVPISRIDDMIMRRLVPSFRIGVFDNPAKRKGDDISTQERRTAAVDVITAGSVLLKNQGSILPFGPNVKSVAIIGTQATAQAVVVEQGSPYVKATHLWPVLDAVKERAGQVVKVSFAPGTLGLAPLPKAPKSMLKTPSGEAGVKVEYFANAVRDFSAAPIATQTEDGFYIDKPPVIAGLPKDLQWSARYSAMFTPAQTGVQKFSLYGSGSAKLFIADKFMGEYLRADFSDGFFVSVPMTAGQPVPIRVEFTPRNSLGAAARDQFDLKLGVYTALGWAQPDNLIEQAAQTAKQADVAVVFVGQRLGEGMDRMTLALPNDQDALIEAVAKANPHTVVVLNTGGGVTMPWLDKVAGVVEMWLPGDAYGSAAAKLLFGDAEPSGRLPVTFPKDETQGPATKSSQYPGTLAADGAVDVTHFDEGIFIGYRYWDQYNQTPLFPFGYGLSYTNFTMKGVGAKAEAGGATVDVMVKNTGTRAGSEVVQVYLGFPKAAGEPPRQLKGMEKVLLKPGEEKRVQVKLDAAAFQYWDENTKKWTTAPGNYQVMVGRDSRNIVYSTNLAAPAR
jgi:beta-glucosidase